MTKQEIITQIRKKKSFLCVGLDPDISKIPKHLLSSEDPLFEFCKQIIDSTNDLCIAYKPNFAFFESEGVKGWMSLEKTINYLNEKYPDIFTIADAKRGDIGNTSKMYASAVFDKLNFDAITVAPYMGEDSVTPFAGYKNKWVILLALTSNKGADDFQLQQSGSKKLFEQVLEKSKQWGNDENMMYVVGATRPEMLKEIRKIVPDHFLLVPGVGAQGGSLQEVAKYGMNNGVGIIVNASRSILYASSENNFAQKAREEAMKMREEMSKILTDFNLC
ncbi:MAG: orotidine-5'-phosphate decarboxylase [Bacteroidota bacterium]